MRPASFEYVRTGSLGEALEALAEPGAVALAGGQTLVNLMRQRVVRPRVVVDLSRLSGLNEVRIEGGRLIVGAWPGLARSPSWIWCAPPARLSPRPRRRSATRRSATGRPSPATSAIPCPSATSLLSSWPATEASLYGAGRASARSRRRSSSHRPS